MRRLFLLGGLVVLAGCSSNSFLGRRTDNFTAYYNTYYNARSSFEEGVRTLEKGATSTPVDRTRYLSLFPQPPRGGNQQFEKAIVKSADVLRDHPDSRWADDALLLIGKSYFYTGQFVGAEQKFREIIYTLAEQRGQASPLEDEARFWLARTLINNEAYDRAEPFLEETLARDGLSRRWQGRYQLVQGELYVQQGRWDEAAEALRAGIDRVRDRDLRARGAFLLGQVEETRGEYSAAQAAYRRVERFKPPYELRYAAQLSGIRVEGQHGNTDAALEALRRMERDGKNYEFRNEIRYVRGLILQAADRPAEALAVYDDVLYGNDGEVASLKGRLHYALGELYRDVYQDYFFAAAHFDTAAASLGPPPVGTVEVYRTPEAILDATDLKTTFGTFAATMREVQEADSLLALGALEPEAFATRIRAIREQRARELAAEQRELERRSAQRAFGGEAGREGAATGALPGTASATAQSGFLSYRDPVRVRENRQAFVDLWGDRPLADNWRRSAAITGTERVELEASLDPKQDSGMLGEGNDFEQLPQVDLSAIPRTVETQARMRTRRAEARYRLGNVLFLNMNRPDSAAAWYRYVIEEDREEVVAPRAYYALAELQRALGDSLAAEGLYRETLRLYPDTDFATRIRERLGLSEPAALDSAALAEAAYEAARTRWKAGEMALAFDSLLAIPARFPTTAAVPKALYGAGMLFLEWSMRDTLDALTTPLPDSSVQRLVPFFRRATAADTLARPDSLEAAPPDAPAESSTAVPADSSVTDDAVQLRYARDLFAYVQQAFARTPYAQQATQMVQALDALADERKPPEAPVPDTLAAPIAAEPSPPVNPETEEGRVTRAGAGEEDEVPTNRPQPLKNRTGEATPEPDERAAGEEPADTLVTMPAEPDERAQVPAQSDTLVAQPLPPPAAPRDVALYGTDPVVSGRGFTIIVGSDPSEAEAQRMASSFREKGYRVGVLPGRAESGGNIFRVGVGQFGTAAEARRALARLSGAVPADAWIFSLR